MSTRSTLLRVLGLGAATLGVVLLLGLGFVKWRYGGGSAYADVSTAPLLPESAIETLVTLDYPPGNVAVSDDGRVFFNYHPFAKAQRFVPHAMFELVGGQAKPFPDAAAQARFQGVFGMTVDRQQRLWLTEPAGLDHARSRVLAFDLKTGQQVFEHWFAPGEARFAQDLRVTPDGRTVILADTGLFKFTPPAILVLDVASKRSRIVLTRHPSLAPQDWVIRTPFGPHKLAYGLVNFTVGVDGIEISPDGRWLYYAAMSHDSLHRVPLAALLDPAQNEDTLAGQIEVVGKKPLSDGITLDRQGGVLLTDIENGGIARVAPTGGLQTLVKSPRIIWADGVVMAPDGAILFTDSAIPAYLDPLARPPARERLEAARPYRLLRIRP